MTMRRAKEIKGRGPLAAERAGQNLRLRNKVARPRPNSEKSSVRPIFSWHFLQRPLRKSQEKIGMFSYQLSCLLQCSQMERRP